MYSVLVNPAGRPVSHPEDDPKETIPTWVQRSPAALLPDICTRGPPESPLQDPRPPAVSMQTTPSPTIPWTSLQSELVMTGMSLTSLRTGEMPPALSEGLPHPVTVTMEPTAGQLDEGKVSGQIVAVPHWVGPSVVGGHLDTVGLAGLPDVVGSGHDVEVAGTVGTVGGGQDVVL